MLAFNSWTRPRASGRYPRLTMSAASRPEDGGLANGVLDDTEPWARRVLTARWRALGTSERLALVREHTAALERLSVLGLRARYPTADEDELRARAAALRVGRELFARLTGRAFEW